MENETVDIMYLYSQLYDATNLFVLFIGVGENSIFSTASLDG